MQKVESKLDFTTYDLKRVLAKKNFRHFSKLLKPENTWKEFHSSYYEILNKFAHKKIKNLIISMPPQHGKSEGSSRLLPAYVLGLEPKTKIAIGSYSSGFAKKFNKAVQRIIDSRVYCDTFPNTYLSQSNNRKSETGYLRNTEEFETVIHAGGLKAVGRGGSLTGNPVDLMIMDDLYKDSMEGNSPTIRSQVKDWYTSVVQKRLHNDSQQLIVFTRWHEDDLVGFIEETDNVVECQSFEEIEKIVELDPDTWIKINFQAIQESDPNSFDSREFGLALWEERHSLKKLQKERAKNELEFNCLNQGVPSSPKSFLYKGFKEYTEIPQPIIAKNNYTDTADQGDDFLCSICYDVVRVGRDKFMYVTDVVYNQDPMEHTEKQVPEMLNRQKTRNARIESNNGGRGFARVVEAKAEITDIETFHQSKNKESRILTNASQVCNHILFPAGWQDRWPLFYNHLTKFKRAFASNKQDDAPDCVTGIYEFEVLENFDYFA